MEVNGYLRAPAALPPGKELFLGSKVRPVRVADNLTGIYEPIV
jgi:hypothetical protein